MRGATKIAFKYWVIFLTKYGSSGNEELERGAGSGALIDVIFFRTGLLPDPVPSPSYRDRCKPHENPRRERGYERALHCPPSKCTVQLFRIGRSVADVLAAGAPLFWGRWSLVK